MDATCVPYSPTHDLLKTCLKVGGSLLKIASPNKSDVPYQTGEYVRDMVEAGEVSVLNVKTADNVADIMTKPMPPERHRLLSGRLRRS